MFALAILHGVAAALGWWQLEESTATAEEAESTAAKQRMLNIEKAKIRQCFLHCLRTFAGHLFWFCRDIVTNAFAPLFVQH